MDTWQTFLVPVAPDRASMEAIAVAAAAAKARRGRLHLLHVIEVGRAMPLNVELDQESRRAQQIIEKAEAAAAELGCQGVRSVVVQAREAGPAIVEEARSQKADVIVLGLPPFEGEDRPFALGPTAEYLLRHAPCEVWLIRRPMRDAYRGGGLEIR
ncbi:MAG: universal stress protein [Tepidiforma sp.]